MIGLVGGVASGKSFVSGLLEGLGCVSINADRVGHELLGNTMIKLQLRRNFGESIFCEDGTVDRNRLGGMVFGTDEEATARRELLNGIMHPAIRTAIVREISRLKNQESGPPAIILDAPLLLEAGWEASCDWIFFVDTPDAIRRRRAQERGWGEAHWQAREHSQMKLDLKRKAATHFIPGDADPEELNRKLQRLLNDLTQTSV